MIESMNVTMTVLMDKYGVAAESYGALELPKTVVIDRGGEIVYEKTGYKSGDENALIKVLLKLEHAEK
jgi:peroxiredoxin